MHFAADHFFDAQGFRNMGVGVIAEYLFLSAAHDRFDKAENADFKLRQLGQKHLVNQQRRAPIAFAIQCA